MSLKKFLKDYLSFGRGERVGILALMILIGIIYLVPELSEKKEPFPLKETSILATAVDSLEIKDEVERYPKSFAKAPAKPVNRAELFFFDPNALPASGWQRLGLEPRTIKTIENYRKKGGRFSRAEDLNRIWGLPGGFYERVKDHILVPQDHVTGEIRRASSLKSSPDRFVVNVNEADSVVWKGLPGVGSKLAARIINFREKLGGFYSAEQIGETYGLPDSVFQKIKSRLVINGPLKKININTATKEELKTHPYIRWNMANAIVEYRNQHGNFKSLDDLKNIATIDEVTFKKIVYYLSLE